MLARSVDFETTGFPPEAGVVEVGWTDLCYDSHQNDRGEEIISNITISEWKNQLLNPGRPIEIAAMAIHHITEDDIKDMPDPDPFIASLCADPDIMVAHNAKFEQEFVKVPGLVWLCTLKAAYRLVPKSPNHQNQTLRYYLKTPVDATLCQPSHRAGPDSYVTAHTLAKLMTAGPGVVQRMIHWTSKPPLMPTCPIGKQRGKPWAEVDHGFLVWMMKQPSMEDDLKYNAHRELNRRHGKTED